MTLPFKYAGLLLLKLSISTCYANPYKYCHLETQQISSQDLSNIGIEMISPNNIQLKYATGYCDNNLPSSDYQYSDYNTLISSSLNHYRYECVPTNFKPMQVILSYQDRIRSQTILNATAASCIAVSQPQL